MPEKKHNTSVLHALFNSIITSQDNGSRIIYRLKIQNGLKVYLVHEFKFEKCVLPLAFGKSHRFLQRRNACNASAVLAMAFPSVCMSVRLSVRPPVRHTPVLYQNDGT